MAASIKFGRAMMNQEQSNDANHKRGTGQPVAEQSNCPQSNVPPQPHAPYVISGQYSALVVNGQQLANCNSTSIKLKKLGIEPVEGDKQVVLIDTRVYMETDLNSPEKSPINRGESSTSGENASCAPFLHSPLPSPTLSSSSAVQHQAVRHDHNSNVIPALATNGNRNGDAKGSDKVDMIDATDSQQSRPSQLNDLLKRQKSQSESGHSPDKSHRTSNTRNSSSEMNVSLTPMTTTGNSTNLPLSSASNSYRKFKESMESKRERKAAKILAIITGESMQSILVGRNHSPRKLPLLSKIGN